MYSGLELQTPLLGLHIDLFASCINLIFVRLRWALICTWPFKSNSHLVVVEKIAT